MILKLVHLETKVDDELFDSDGNSKLTTLALKVGDLETDYDIDIRGNQFVQPTLSDVNNGYMGEDGSWNSGNYSLYIDVSRVRGYHITRKSVQYAFLKTKTTAVGESCTFVDGGSRISGSLSSVIIPDDANYLYVYCGTSLPTSLDACTFDEEIEEGLLKRTAKLESGINEIEPIKEQVDLLEWTDGVEQYTFDSSKNSYATLNNKIVLSKDGDSIEFAIVGSSSVISDNTIYSFARCSSSLHSMCAIGISKSIIIVRSEDDTWIVPLNKIYYSEGDVVKISYEDSKIVTYLNGVSAYTYDEQKQISIDSFGNGGNASKYWSGIIKDIKVNGESYLLSKNSVLTNVGIETVGDYHYFLPKDKMATLLAEDYPKCRVICHSESHDVYMQDDVQKDLYYKLTINHETNSTEMGYENLWRIASEGDMCEFDGTTFTSKGIKLLCTPENEFTLKFTGKADFTGGFHGDERIDIESGCYAKFLVDGVETTLTSGQVIDCKSFTLLQKSTLHDTATEDAPTTPISGHPIIARHWKETTFCNQGYKTHNRVVFDFSAITDTERTISVWFAGLACINKNCAEKLYAADMEIHTAKNDAGSFEIGVVEDSRVEMWSDTNKSRCTIMSKTLTEDDSKCSLKIWDRNPSAGDYDEKYYRIAPSRTVKTDDVFASEMTVRWGKS